MPLTDTKLRKSKPREKNFKLFDERGLYIEIAPSGGKWWRFKYRYNGKEKCLSLGIYPDVSLKRARDRRDEARGLLADGVDPSEHRKALKRARVERAANSFEVMAREWFAKHEPNWAESHSARLLRLFERDVFPWIGGRPVAEITAPELLSVVRRIEERGALGTAHRAIGNCGQVFRYAIATGRAERDPSVDLRGALPPARKGHFAAITDPKQLGDVLRAINGYQGTLVVKCALRVAPLVFVRPGELRTAKWADIDLDAAEWCFTVSKTGNAHIVPLASQAMKILRELHPVTGNGQFVFPGARSPRRPMSENAILVALRSMNFSKEMMSVHGFRAIARTLLDEKLGYAPHLIEHQLAHAVRDPMGRAYNRTAHLSERQKMMQAWADYLEGLAAGANVVPLIAGQVTAR